MADTQERDDAHAARPHGGYAGIVEIFESRTPHLANQFLDRGYELLRIEGISISGRHSLEPGNGAGSYFVARQVRYIVGRTAAVEHVSLNDLVNRPATVGETIAIAITGITTPAEA